MKGSWKNDVFQVCFASLSQNNGGLPSNDNNNDTAKRNASGHNAHLLVRIILACSPIRTSCTPRFPTLAFGLLSLTFLRVFITRIAVVL